MLAVVQEVNIGMDSPVSSVMEEDLGILLLIVVHVPMVKIGMELSVSPAQEVLTSMVIVASLVSKVKYGIPQILFVNVHQVSNGMV